MVETKKVRWVPIGEDHEHERICFNLARVGNPCHSLAVTIAMYGYKFLPVCDDRVCQTQIGQEAKKI